MIPKILAGMIVISVIVAVIAFVVMTVQAMYLSVWVQLSPQEMREMMKMYVPFFAAPFVVLPVAVIIGGIAAKIKED